MANTIVAHYSPDVISSIAAFWVRQRYEKDDLASSPDALDEAAVTALKSHLRLLDTIDGPSLQMIFAAGVSLGLASAVAVFSDPLGDGPAHSISKAVEAAESELEEIYDDAAKVDPRLVARDGM